MSDETEQVESPRLKLPPKRRNILVEIEFQGRDKMDHRPYQVGFGFDRQNIIREVFCAAHNRESNNIQSLIHDACVGMSYALQHGARMSEFVHSFGSYINEHGYVCAQSALGQIARVGVRLEEEEANHAL